MADVIIGVDAGRSGTKMCKYENGKYVRGMFNSKHGIIDLSHLRNLPVMSFNTDDTVENGKMVFGDMIASIDNSPTYAIGSTVDILLPPENTIYATHDEIYLEYATMYVLNMLGKSVKDGDDVTLGINLTFNNNKFSEEVKEKLKGMHNVKYFSPKGKTINEVNFNVKRITVLPQGWASLMSKYINDDLTTDPLYAKEGITIDVGRKTVDVIFSRGINILKGSSLDLGTEYIFEIIKGKIFAEYGVKKSTVDIESAVLNGDKIFDRKGNEIDPRTYLKSSIIDVATRIINELTSAYAEYTPQFCILTGGGSVYFKEPLMRIFPTVKVLDDFQFTNSIGIAKFIAWNLFGK